MRICTWFQWDWSIQANSVRIHTQFHWDWSIQAKRVRINTWFHWDWSIKAKSVRINTRFHWDWSIQVSSARIHIWFHSHWQTGESPSKMFQSNLQNELQIHNSNISMSWKLIAVFKKTFLVESECNQARFGCWHILLSGDHTNSSWGEQFWFLFAVVGTIPPYYTLPSWHSPCPTNWSGAYRQTSCAQGSYRKILSKFTNLCNMVRKSNTNVHNSSTHPVKGCNP